MKLHSLIALSAAMLVPLASCSDDSTPSTEAEAEAGGGTIPEALGEIDNMSRTAQALEKTGIAGIFNNQGSYTLLAPSNEALAKLDDADSLFESEEGSAALAALLRLHILPGYLSPDDISKAIADAPDGKVVMTTLDGVDLEFSAQNDRILVTSADGVTARLAGEPVVGEKSIAIPVDAVLRKP